jgi:hypothetical protein
MSRPGTAANAAQRPDFVLVLPSETGDALRYRLRWAWRVMAVLIWGLALLVTLPLLVVARSVDDFENAALPVVFALFGTAMLWGSGEAGPLGVPPVKMRVTSEMIEFSYPGGTVRKLDWSSPRLRIKLVDYLGREWKGRVPGPASHRYWLSPPTGRNVRIPEEMFARILSEVGTAHLRVVEHLKVRREDLGWAPKYFATVRTFDVRSKGRRSSTVQITDPSVPTE